MIPLSPFTAEQLRQELDYDPITGLFRWRTTIGHRKRGWWTGARMAKNYCLIGFRGRRYLAHRLAWLLMHERWPEAEIDHINGNPADNRIINLREATRSQNMRNVGAYRSNKSGLRGVSQRNNGRWTARIRVPNGPYRSLGEFSSMWDAKAAYEGAAKKYNGDFIRGFS